MGHKGYPAEMLDVAELTRASVIINRYPRAMLQVSDHQAMSLGSSEWPSAVYICPL